MPLGYVNTSINPNDYNTVVYDTQTYTYSTILKLLNNNNAQKLRLGTYSSKTKKLITEEFVFDYNEIISKR